MLSLTTPTEVCDVFSLKNPKLSTKTQKTSQIPGRYLHHFFVSEAIRWSSSLADKKRNTVNFPKGLWNLDAFRVGVRIDEDVFGEDLLACALLWDFYEQAIWFYFLLYQTLLKRASKFLGKFGEYKDN